MEAQEHFVLLKKYGMQHRRHSNSLLHDSSQAESIVIEYCCTITHIGNNLIFMKKSNGSDLKTTIHSSGGEKDKNYKILAELNKDLD
ncbi:hypothetical protein CR513_11035, partial [Mucuna pruriens]